MVHRQLGLANGTNYPPHGGHSSTKAAIMPCWNRAGEGRAKEVLALHSDGTGRAAALKATRNAGLPGLCRVDKLARHMRKAMMARKTEAEFEKEDHFRDSMPKSRNTILQLHHGRRCLPALPLKFCSPLQSFISYTNHGKLRNFVPQYTFTDFIRNNQHLAFFSPLYPFHLSEKWAQRWGATSHALLLSTLNMPPLGILCSTDTLPSLSSPGIQKCITATEASQLAENSLCCFFQSYFWKKSHPSFGFCQGKWKSILLISFHQSVWKTDSARVEQNASL